MKYVDEFRDGALARSRGAAIAREARLIADRAPETTDLERTPA